MKHSDYYSSPLLQTDAYKIGHQLLYPEGTEIVYSTLTPRVNSYFPWNNKMVVFGYEIFFKNLADKFEREFFSQPREWAVGNVVGIISDVMGKDVANRVKEKFYSLHDLGYLPIMVKALPEGSLVPMKVPVLTIENTDPDFYWLPGYLETSLLSETFVTSTVASIAREFKAIGYKYGKETSDNIGDLNEPSYIDFQFHDFSERGQHGNDAARLSGMAHLTSFFGTDILQAVAYIKEMFPETENIIGGSVLATEHSVMEVLGTDQFKAYKSLIDANPNGILSVVSDTYDYWEVINDVLPALKDDILSRDGKLVIRPDSLDDVEKGIVETLRSMWETFGGTVNSKGYKVLDNHIGLLHGEGVTLDTIHDYMRAIKNAGFSTENVVFGVGAYVYSVLASRDSFGQALKATSATVNGVERAVFKDPKTSTESFKKSLKGRVVVSGKSGSYSVQDGYTEDNMRASELKTIYAPDYGFDDYVNDDITPLDTIRKRINNGIMGRELNDNI